MFSVNAGIDNALKMKQMYETTMWKPLSNKPKYWARFYCDGYNDVIQLEVGPVHHNGFKEAKLATYKFESDGSYTTTHHN